MASWGLVLGLFAYPATAWFAILEVGVPAGMCGAVLGALAGLLANGVQRTSSRSQDRLLASIEEASGL